MPIPHRTQMQVIKRRLTGKEGSARLRELRAILDDLPNYKNGPYADIRAWVMEEIEQTRGRGKQLHRDSIAVRCEGAAQVALVGPPNAGKSSLLHALSEVQIKIGNYAFTTVRPVPALIRIGGVLVQLVEIPGLIAGASEDKGGGRALLGVLRGADAMVLCHDCTAPLTELHAVRAEVAAAGIVLPTLLAATKCDEVDATALESLRAAVPELPVCGVSIIDDDSLRAFKEAVWRLTGLIRVSLRYRGQVEPEPLALPVGATVADAATALHNALGQRCTGGRVWGPSARFAAQPVGRQHVLMDTDVLEIGQ